jgi:hypothetical protein
VQFERAVRTSWSKKRIQQVAQRASTCSYDVVDLLDFDSKETSAHRWPSGHACYVLFGPDWEPIYVGKTTDIGRRLGNHRSSKSRWKISPKYVQVICVNPPYAEAWAAWLEKVLIFELQPISNRLLYRFSAEDDESGVRVSERRLLMKQLKRRRMQMDSPLR